MPDPLDALRQPDEPVAPDPFFAAHLRARVARALDLPKGVTVSNLALDPEPVADTEEPQRSPVIVPYLIVADARRALDWYADAMGATRLGEPLVMPDGRIGHAELDFAGGTVFLADEPSAAGPPGSDVAAPRPGDGATVSLTLSVPDVDRLAERAVRAGGVLERAAADYPHGRNAVIRDPFGHRWIVSAPPRPAGPAVARPSDVVYVSLWVPDGDRAADFFAQVLGWSYRPGSGPGRQVEGQSLPHGLYGGQDRSTLFLCFAVDDIAAGVERVRVAGGHGGAPTDEPYGRIANCVDNQGVRFALVEAPPRAAQNGERHGDVSYVSMEVEDSAKARAFYGSVLNWSFSPGRVDDGWGPADVVPTFGMHGGHDQATTVPMYRVDDIHAAVARVRAQGGTSSDPLAQSYGLMAECVDDQGTRFYLGQH